jgi:hypothetical protein
MVKENRCREPVLSNRGSSTQLKKALMKRELLPALTVVSSFRPAKLVQVSYRDSWGRSIISRSLEFTPASVHTQMFSRRNEVMARWEGRTTKGIVGMAAP